MLYAGVAHSTLDPRLLTIPTGNDVWFEADIPVVADTILHRASDQSRNAHHPLFPLWTTVPSYVMRALTFPPWSRLSVLVIAAAGLWGVTTFLLLRFLTATRLDAITFTALACSSAAAVFWLPMVETYVLGSATLLVPFALAAWDTRRKLPDWAYVAASAVSLSVSTTNWMSGIIVALRARPLRAAIQVTVNALVIIVCLWTVQKVFVATTPFFLGADPGRRFIFAEAAGGPVNITRALVFHSVVMPDLDVVLEPRWGPRLSVQGSTLGSSGSIGAAATVLWAALLSIGIASLMRSHGPAVARRSVAPALVAQLIFYNCYGEESCLYALHVAPLLVVCASAATATPFRRWVLLGTWVLIVLLALNNVALFSQANQFVLWGRPAGF